MSAVRRPSSPDRGLSRRALLRAITAAGGAALAGGALSGCDLNNPFDGTPTPAAEAVRDLSPDVAVAVSAAAAIRETDAVVATALTAFPALGSRLAAYRALHTAHLAAVEDAVPDGVDTAPTATVSGVPATKTAAALRRVTVAETALHASLTELAMKAESGAFARLLGSMAAAVSQQQAALR